MQITNDGPRILSTDYWLTPHAARGLLWFSWNAGALRILVPPATEHLLQELPPPGTPATYYQRQTTRVLLYEDDPEQPYAIEVDPRQSDRTLPRSDDGRSVGPLWYAQEGEQGVRLLREEQITVRVETPAPRQDQPTVLMAPSCSLQAFSLDAAGVPVPVPVATLSEALELLARDPLAEWVPQPTGPYAKAARLGRPSGTAAWHCMLAAPSTGDLLVRPLWDRRVPLPGPPGEPRLGAGARTATGTSLQWCHRGPRGPYPRGWPACLPPPPSTGCRQGGGRKSRGPTRKRGAVGAAGRVAAVPGAARVPPGPREGRLCT